MADLNPLKFGVAIQDDATKKLNEIETKLNSLKDKTIKINVEGGEDIQKAFNIDTLVQQIQAAKKALQGNSFDTFEKHMSKAAESVELLTKNIGLFEAALKNDNGLRSYLAGLGEVVRNIRQTMGGLEGVRNLSPRNNELIFNRNKRIYGEILADAEKLIQRLNAVEAKRASVHLDTSLVRRGAEDVARFIDKLTQLDRANFGDTHAINELRAQFNRLRSVYGAIANEQNKVTGTTQQLTAEQQRLAQSLKGGTTEMHSQSQVLSDLKSLATQYLGVWGAQGFLNNIIKIGGQLESQRLSLTAILGQRSYANDLFENIQSLALKSPFGVVQLDQYSKNLSAFGFQYNELFDMTKRLADIAAGTGTDFGRLALALGHVRSEMALTGYTLRQFSMANVPMLKKLSENLGVTTSEIRKMVREKKVSYEDVEKVLKDLTDEGGMFYNMQEVMSEAVSAKFKNLKDSMDIMYGQMAESAVGDMLKGIAVALMEVTKRWQTYGTVLLTTASLIGAYKLYMHMLNVGIKTNTINLLQNTVATKALTASEIEQMVEKKLLTAQDVALALAEGRLSIEQAKGALIAAGYTEAIIAEIAATNGLSGAIAGLKASTSGMVAFLTNPWTATLIAIEAVIGAVMAYKTWSDDIDNDVNRVLERYKTSSQEIGKYLRGSEKEGKPTDDRDLSAEIEQMKTILQNSELYTEELQEQISLAPSLSAEYDVLIGKMKDANGNLEKMGINADVISQAIKHSSGDFNSTSFSENLRWFFNDDVNKNSEQLEKSYSQYQRIISTLDEYQAKMKSAVGVMIDVYHHGELANLPFEEQIRLLAQDKDAWKTFVAIVDGGSGKFVDVAEKLKDAANDVSDDWSEIVNDDVPRMMNKMAELFRKTPDEFREWAKTHNTIFQNMLDTMVSAVKIASPKIATALRNAILGWLNGDSNTNFEQPVETPQQRFDRERREIQAKRNAIIKGYGKIGKHAMTTLTDFANSNGKKGLFDINFVGDYFKAEGSTSDGLDAIAKDYKKYKGLIAAAKKAGNTAEEKIYERRFNQLDAAMDAFGLDKTKGDKKQKQGEKDKEAKELRERVRILKEAADSYQYWRDKVGDKGAEGHVNDEFGKLLSEQGFKFENALKFREALQELRKEYEKKPQSKAMLEALKELDRELAQLDRKDFEKHSEDFISSMKSELDMLTRSWEIYNSVRSSTGDRTLAEHLSGISNFMTLADVVRAKLTEELSSLGAGGSLSFGSNLSDRELEKEVFAAVPKSTEESVEQYEERIKGLVEVYKKWRDLQRDVEKADIAAFNKLVESSVDLQSQLMRINEEYAQIIEKLDRSRSSGKITDAQYGQAKRIADANLQMKTVLASREYQFLMDGIVTMSRKAAQTIKDRFIIALDNQLRAGIITAKDYADKIEEINEKMRNLEHSQSNVTSYMKGGLNGLFENMANRGKGMIEQGAALQQAGANEMISFEYGGETFQMPNFSKMMQGGQMSQMGGDMMQGAQGAMATMSIIDTIVHGIDNLVQGLKNTFDEIREMFQALGKDVNTDGWEDANTFFSSFSSASASATKGWDSLKNGNVGGVIEGVVGSFTGWITGFAKGHDKKRQNHIDALMRNVNALEANTEVIKALRNRILGYDTGTLRRYLATIYQGNDPASNAMRNFYMTNISGSGYAQELANLEEQRANYMQMYNEEDDKKDVSEEALLEYKKKIAELDEQIRYFTEDLAKELWDIDIKGWADQLSDGLSSAFENGESAAKAYKDTVTNILQSVMNKMMQMAILEPMFQSLQDKLFGNAEKNIKGVFDTNNPMGSMAAVTSAITSFFGNGGEGEKTVTAALEFMNAFERGLNNAGLSVLNKDSSNTLSSSMQGTSEDTSDLLAAYVNAARQDLAASRLLLAQFIMEVWPSYIEQISGAVRSLNNIDQNVAFIRALLSENGALYMMIDSMKTHFDNIINGNESVAVQ